jgi:hypothetical protein
MSDAEKKSAKRIFRVVLRDLSETTLGNWRTQLQQTYPQFEPSFSELVAWAIERQPVLSKKELHEIKARFFDEVKEIESLLVLLRRAKASGDETAIQQILSNGPTRRKTPAAKPPQVTENNKENEQEVSDR